MDKWKTHKIILFVILCTSVNCAGKLIAEACRLPVWLDSLGTVLGAYVMGPVCGAMIGAGSGIMSAAFAANSYLYAITNFFIGLISGVLAKRGMMKKAFGAFSLSIILAVTATVVSLPLNLYYFDGGTGNLWGDGVIAYFTEFGLHTGVCRVLGEFYVDLVDMLISVFFAFYAVKLRRRSRKTTLPKKGAAVVALIVLLTGIPMFQHNVSADESNEDDVYDSFIQTIYNNSNGIPGGQVNDIAQTRDGLLWIGTNGGLYQYDGSNFTFMSGFDTVRSVNCLYTDEEGRLWVGTSARGLSVVSNNEVVNVIDTTGGLSADSVRSIVKASDGLYYVGTSEGLCAIALADGMKVQKVYDGLRYVCSLSASRDGYVSAVTAAGELAILKDSVILGTYNFNAYKDTFTTAYFDESGNLYAATHFGTIVKYSVNGGELNMTATIPCPGMTGINRICMKDGLRLFICADNGIGYMDSDYSFKMINSGNFNSSITNMLTDYQGNLWFSSSKLGLLELSESVIEELYPQAGLSETVVNAVIKWNDNYYFGTDTGVDVLNPELTGTVESPVSDLLDNVRVSCFTVDSRDNLWVATAGEGVYRIRTDGSYLHYDTSDGLAGDKITVLLELKSGIMLVGTDSGITYISGGVVVDGPDADDGLMVPQITCAVEFNGKVYVGTDGGGIVMVSNGEIERIIKKSDGLSSDVILRMHETSDSRGLILVTSNGLNYLGHNGTIVQKNSIPYYNNYDVLSDGKGNLWFTGSAGIYIVNEESFLHDKEVEYELLDAKMGLRTSFTPGSWNYVDGSNLILCSGTGAILLDMDKYSVLRSSYRIMLECIALDGTMAAVDKEDINVIDRDVTKIEFFPKVINYSASDPYVSVWLEGFDKEPLVLLQSDLETLVYTNLPAGKYTFRLAILDGHKDKILEEVSYSFVKENALYDNWWFSVYIVFVLSIITVYLVWLIVGSQINAGLKMQKKELENLKLKQTADAAVAAGEAKDRFLALMSHDIRTPINAILGMNEMIIRESSEDTIQDYAGDIKEAGNTLLSLVNTILDYSKIEEGKMEIVPVNYESRRFFTNLIRATGTRAKEKGLEFRVDIDKNIPKVLYGDDMRISQVISNLLTNAIKYTEKGYVELIARVFERTDDDVVLYVEVRDSGIGIRKEDMDRMFDSFQRLDEERNRNIEGTGLGMSIVSNLLSLMDSRLEVESEYGVGSKFSFLLRQKAVSRDDAETVSGSALPKQTRHVYAPDARLLIVDDNAMNLKVTTRLLKVNGIVPDTALSGADAIEMVKHNHYDIIYLDHMMPEMDGVETLNNMRENNLLSGDTKVIILTANAISGAREQYLKQGFDDYLSKPIEVDILEAQLAKYLRYEENGGA